MCLRALGAPHFFGMILLFGVLGGLILLGPYVSLDILKRSYVFECYALDMYRRGRIDSMRNNDIDTIS